MEKISKEMARSFLVNYQGLNDLSEFEGLDGTKEFLQRVRCIQFDPLNVVGRNPDLVLQARVTNYRPEMLEKLLYQDRVLVDGADKELSIFMTEDYPKMARVRKAKTAELERTFAYRGSLEALDVLEEVKNYVRDHGPQPANKIDVGGRAKEGRWGHKKLSSAALDYLYHAGQLGISHKLKTQKAYDLSENLLPKEILNCADPFASERDFLKWYVMHRIGSIGMVRNKNSGAWLGKFLGDQKARTEIIEELALEGELLALRVEDSKETYYVRREDARYLEKGAEESVAKFLAPLDNLIWDRGMAEDLFDFQYSWEVYTPASKRKYGYYVLPVLYKNRFVARFEPEKKNGQAPLQIKNWWWEPGVMADEEMTEAIRAAFQRFSDYLGVERMKERSFRKAIKG